LTSFGVEDGSRREPDVLGSTSSVGLWSPHAPTAQSAAIASVRLTNDGSARPLDISCSPPKVA
jgi:hypothetical protein